MKVYQTKEIRNIALVGGAKSGKTTLAESMLFESGLINRRGTIEGKNTVSDYRDIEIERQNSISSTLLYSEYNGKKINIIDCPGFDDFVGEVVAAIKVVDLGVMVVNAQNGVEVSTEIAWRYGNTYNTPFMFAINHLEHEQSNFDENIRQLRSLFSPKVTLLQYPLNTGLGFNSIIDVLKMKMYKYPSDGGKPEILDIPADQKSKAEELQSALVEAAAEGDEALMEVFFDKGTLTEEEILSGLHLGLVNRSIFPVVCICSKQNMGVAVLMDYITSLGPNPEEASNTVTTEGKKVPCVSSGFPCVFVFKTSSEQHLGEISFFKVISGEITESLDMVNPNRGSKERVSQLFAIAGKSREKVEKLVAGDIGATIKLKNTLTSNTLNVPKNGEMIIEPILFPNPKNRVAVKAKNSADDEKIGGILNDLAKIDPTLIVAYSKELKQLILQGQGELHLNIAKWHLETVNKIDVDYLAPKIQYRETITKNAKSMYRHKKQSGGAGQFGEVHMLMQPYIEGMLDQKEFPIRDRNVIELDWGGKLVMNNCIVGGAIDARFIPAILKGIMEKIEEGPLTGSYARDIVVNIYDGKMHPVDSNEISFKLAGRHAFKEAFKNAGPKILEPIYDVEVMVPEDKMGDVITDLQGRRGIMMGMDSQGSYQIVKARVPLAEMNRYSTALSSITSGRATYSMKYLEYAQVPPDVQIALLKAYEEQEKEDE